MSIKKCKYCKKEIEFKKYQQYAGHIKNCKQHPNFEIMKKRMLASRPQQKNFKKICPKCNTTYIIKITEYQHNKNNYRKHCTQNCANGHKQTKEQNQKRSKKLTGRKMPIKVVKKIMKHKENIIIKKNKFKK